ncbi:GntR family transcriptional regulator [Rhizobium laguerreae]|nr:GntR family transcriptional regulator [Rhizobium laguerreae]
MLVSISSKSPAERKKSSSVYIYECLRQEILTLEIAPGAVLDETKIADRFEVSRAPVREAFIRLSGEKLALILPGRSTVVTPIDMMEFPNYAHALDIAQRVNTIQAARNRTDDDLAEITDCQREWRKAMSKSDALGTLGANREFHLAIARSGRNDYFIEFYAKLLDQGQRIMLLHYEYLDRTREGYLLSNDHEQMIEAIRLRDTDSADKVAHSHAALFHSNFINFMSEQRTAPIEVTVGR